MTDVMRILAPVAGLLGLAACGGGGSSATLPGSFGNLGMDAPPSQLSELRLNSLTSAGRDSGTLNHSTTSISGQTDLSGTLNADYSQVTTLGGVVTLSKSAGAVYARVFDDAGQIGVIGVVTGSGNLPTDTTANYSGASTVTINDTAALYELSGNASVTANFGASGGTASVTLNGLNGTRDDGGSVTNVSNAATILITGSAINAQGEFTGGTASVTGSLAVTSNNVATVRHVGQTFGPDAAEIGGVLGLSNSAGLQVQGRYLTTKN